MERRYVLKGLLAIAIVGCKAEPPKPIDNEPEAIKTARRLQKEALARGEFKIPLPRVITGLDGIKFINYEARFSGLPSDAKQILIEIPSPNPKKNLLFPALVEGKVVEIHDEPDILKEVKIQMGDQIWSFSGEGNLLVKTGEEVSLGEPIINLNLQVPNPVRLGEFLRNVIFIGAYHVNENMDKSRLTLDDSILKAPNGQAILIPNYG